MLGTSWECHKVREFALRPMGDFFCGCWTMWSSLRKGERKFI